MFSYKDFDFVLNYEVEYIEILPVRFTRNYYDPRIAGALYSMLQQKRQIKLRQMIDLKRRFVTILCKLIR